MREKGENVGRNQRCERELESEREGEWGGEVRERGELRGDIEKGRRSWERGGSMGRREGR